MSATVVSSAAPPIDLLTRRFGSAVSGEARPEGDVPTIRVDAARLPEVAAFLRDDPSAAYDHFLDVAAVDLSKLAPGHPLHDRKNRFQANYLVRSNARNAPLRIRVNVPENAPVIPSLVPVWKGANWFEREAWDLMGIRFEGHPNLARLLTHNGFVGHALRKDYDAGQRWLCTEEDLLQTQLAAKADVDEDVFETITMNLGPQHPATHGTLRIVLRLDGETIVGAESECGYLHRCFEKMAETHTFQQVIPYTDRLNYCSPMLNGNGYCYAVEKMLGLDIPPRAKAARIVLSELARIMDHMVCIGTNFVDLGGLTNFWYAYRCREEIYSILEACCGARLTSSYARIGGLANDLPADFVERVRAVLPNVRRSWDDVNTLITRNRIAQKRMRGTGVVTKEQALAWGFTGPCLRASGVPYDLRKDQPYEGYDALDFDVPVATDGDNFARYLVRMEEIKQSIRIIEQVLAKLPKGAWITDDYRVALPPKEMVYNEMEALIYHFKVVFEGVKVPPGDFYAAVEGGNGELGFHIVGDGGGSPYRMKVRPPCFPIFAAFDDVIKGGMVADAIATLGTFNVVAGELDR